MSSRCPLCRFSDSEVIGKRSDFLPPGYLQRAYGPFVDSIEQFDRDVVRCAVCGFQYISPPYTLEDFADLYDHERYSRFSSQFPPIDEFQSPAAREFLDVLKSKSDHLKIPLWVESFRKTSSRRPTFLDVGCGKGQYLLIFDELGFDVTGIDSSRAQVEWVRSRLPFRVENVSLRDFGADGTFDCIFACHVIEHQSDPHGFLEDVMRLLAPGGIFMLETPVIQDWGRPEQRYRDIYHTLFFDHFTLSLAASMHGARVLNHFNVRYREQSGIFVADALVSFCREVSLERTLSESTLRNLRAIYEQTFQVFSEETRKHLNVTSGRSIFVRGLYYFAQKGFAATVAETVKLAQRKLAGHLNRRGG